jgi:WD40 repeat protein
MNLTTAKFAKNKIFTASIDRSIRIWDKKTGVLLKSLTDHKGTVNKLKVSKDESQLVSTDLKGGIQFLNLE